MAKEKIRLGSQVEVALHSELPAIPVGWNTKSYRAVKNFNAVLFTTVFSKSHVE